MGMPGNYSWCGATGEVPIVKDNLWDISQPDFKFADRFFYVSLLKNLAYLGGGINIVFM
jgi:hypothetical protein